MDLQAFYTTIVLFSGVQAAWILMVEPSREGAS
jgi:hypothetical protein